jgi:hypothetical protein
MARKSKPERFRPAREYRARAFLRLRIAAKENKTENDVQQGEEPNLVLHRLFYAAPVEGAFKRHRF